MAYLKHWLFVMGGTLNASGTNSEIWQCGVRGIPAASTDYGSEDAVLANIAPLVSDWFSAESSVMSSLATLDYIKLNEIAPDGSYAHPVTHQHDYAPHVAGAATTAHPQILTVAFSWVTDAVRGLAHTGRIYPPVAIVANTSMILSTADQDAYAASGIALLNAIGARPAADPGTAFEGIAAQVVSSQGVSRAVVGCRVGSIIDVQRRRKDALPETYRSASF